MNTEIPPTVTPDALTAILHKRADQRLFDKLHDLSAPLDLAQWGAIDLSTANRLSADAAKCRVYIPVLVKALREALFSAEHEAARATEVAEFLAKVENTAAELDAIREEMHQ